MCVCVFECEGAYVCVSACEGVFMWQCNNKQYYYKYLQSNDVFFLTHILLKCQIIPGGISA